MGRVLALDPGTVRIGVAISDPLGMIAQPHSSLETAGGDVLDEISNLVHSLGVDRIVVGLPVSLDGSERKSAATARTFGQEVAAATGIDVEMIDERFSSVTAEKAMIEAGARRSERKTARDRVAAAVFLQSYLDGSR
jgi:putative holliday junction resolvase